MNFDKQVEEMGGVFSAIFTPYDSDGEVNFDMLTGIAEYQLANGVTGFFVAGSTGESLLLSEEERDAVVRHMCNSFSDRATIIAHVGHPSTDVASRLAVKAANAGADWIASVAPIYYGTSFAGALRHYGQISSATDLPFMVYSLGGVIDPERDSAFFELPNVCGLKYTGANFFSVQQLQRKMDRRIALMSGFDEQFVAGQSFGFDGGIGTTFNFAPQFYSEIFQQYRNGNIDEAARIQAEINQVTYLMISHENRSYQKAIMKYIGFDCGWARAPFAPLTDEQFNRFANQLDAIQVLKRNHGADAAMA